MRLDRLDTKGWRAHAESLEAEGKLVDALDALTQANRQRRDPAIEGKLVALRHQAYPELRRSRGPSSWPVISPDDDLVATGPPAVLAEELTPELLSTGILRHGCLHVRRLVPERRVELLIDGIDRAIAGFDAHASGAPADETAPWFVPLKPNPEFSVGVKRKWVRDSGGVWTADSPRVLFDLVDTIDSVGLGPAISAYFGERPVLSVNKCTLRRVGLDPTNANWHQDGAFLGDGIRSVNVWLALSHCGRDAPGLDIVPRRLDHVVETGTDGAMFHWAVGQGVVDTVSAASPVCRPQFEPGDVLLFDDLFLHRTAVDSRMNRHRYAIETWFFAPSVYPDGQIPLVY
jgi:Phytanoyl-CoA dioxygenase (PhyH)